MIMDMDHVRVLAIDVCQRWSRDPADPSIGEQLGRLTAALGLDTAALNLTHRGAFTLRDVDPLGKGDAPQPPEAWGHCVQETGEACPARVASTCRFCGELDGRDHEC